MVRQSTMPTLLLLGGVATAIAAATPALGQGALPFDLVGPIQRFVLENTGDPFSGARLTVNGQEVVVPGALRIQFPARFLRPREVFNLNPRSVGPGESGLALQDQEKPLAAFEAAVQGNFVNGTAVAGSVGISQDQLFNLTGSVLEIHGDRSEMLIGSQGGPPARIRLNDPEGRFGASTRPADPNALPSQFRPDERFRVDMENPSVRSATGFPMCIQRTPGDTDCPSSNRPDSERNFWTGARPLNMPDWIAPCPSCDPNRMVPFQVGDYVTITGIIAQDQTGSYVLANSVVTSLGIYTRPGEDPAYVVVDEALIGTGATPPNLPLEGQDRLRVEGWSTDRTRSVSVYALDVAPDGAKTSRLIAVGLQPDSDPFGRVRIRRNKTPDVLRDAEGVLRGAPREVMLLVDGPNGARLPDGTVIIPAPSAGGNPPSLPQGRYIAPVGEFIFAENTRPGDPPVEHDFACLGFLLTDASAFEDGATRAGAISPWPGAGGVPPAEVRCGQ